MFMQWLTPMFAVFPHVGAKASGAYSNACVPMPFFSPSVQYEQWQDRKRDSISMMLRASTLALRAPMRK